MNARMLRYLSCLIGGLGVASACYGQAADPPALSMTSTIGVARRNAANVDLGARAERRLNMLPRAGQVDLANQLSGDASRARDLSVHLKYISYDGGHVSGANQTWSRAQLDSVRSFSEAGHDYMIQAFSLDSHINNLPTSAPASASITYKPEYLLPKLNPTLAICQDRIWTKSDFVYQAKINRVATALRSLSLSVGLFSVYRQTNKSGIPRPADLQRAAAGSGVAIASDLVITNQHVVTLMAVDASLDPSQWKLDTSKSRFFIGFPVETTACARVEATAVFEVVDIVYAGKGADFDDDIAVLRVRSPSGLALQPVDFDPKPSFAADSFVGVIGYPDKPDPDDYVPPKGNGLFPDVASLEAYFDLPNSSLPKYRIARFGLGTLVDLNDPERRIIGHDAPTDNSSSGSLVVSLETGRAIGLHAGGNLGAGSQSGVNIAYRSDYIVEQLRLHHALPDPPH